MAFVICSIIGLAENSESKDLCLSNSPILGPIRTIIYDDNERTGATRRGGGAGSNHYVVAAALGAAALGAAAAVVADKTRPRGISKHEFRISAIFLWQCAAHDGSAERRNTGI